MNTKYHRFVLQMIIQSMSSVCLKTFEMMSLIREALHVPPQHVAKPLGCIHVKGTDFVHLTCAFPEAAKTEIS